jgi:hypothetical protein
MTQQEVATWVAFMREQGIKSLAVSGLRLELGASSSSYSAQEAPVASAGVFEDGTGSVCACGHSWATEHGVDGCLMGCSHDLCSSAGGTTYE